MRLDPRLLASLAAAAVFAVTGVMAPAPAAAEEPVVSATTASDPDSNLAPTLLAALAAEPATAPRADAGLAAPELTALRRGPRKAFRIAYAPRRPAFIRLARADLPPSGHRGYSLLGVGFGF